MPAIPEADEFKPEEDSLESPPEPLTLSDVVRQSPIGALIGAFVAGFLIARIL